MFMHGLCAIQNLVEITIVILTVRKKIETGTGHLNVLKRKFLKDLALLCEYLRLFRQIIPFHGQPYCIPARTFNYMHKIY